MDRSVAKGFNFINETINDIDLETLKERLIKIFGYSAAIYLIYTTSKSILSTFFLIKRNREQCKNIPSPPGNWFFGTIAQFKDKEKVPEKVIKWSKKFNGLYWIQFGPSYIRVVVGKASLAKEIFMSNEPKDPKIYGFVRDWLGDGLLLSQGAKWFRNRRLLTPAFHYDILKPYAFVFNECANVLVDKWSKSIDDGKDNIEAFNDVGLMTLDSLLQCIFGEHTNCQLSKTTHPYLQAVERITFLTSRRITSVFSSIPFLYHLTPSGIKRFYHLYVLHSFTKGIISQKKKKLSNGKDDNGIGLTDQEIADEVDTFMFEGHDTTASGLSWCLYNLANNPEIQEKARREVLMIFEEKGSDNLEWDDLSKLSYLTRVIRESLRLSPPVPFVSRQVTEEKTLSNGQKINVGTPVSLSIFAIQRDEEEWPNPEIFDPDRHLKDSKNKRDPFAFVAFSAGPRNCIGQNFAMNEMKIVMAVLLKNFRFHKIDGKEPKMSFQLILKSLNGINLRIEKL
ncbi:DgyrCDS9678 [Dimorphilus gyrociliatus]|uniref:DgyrCDS9678 n=1 Tax=Dimorphilus gyrociliatus TaxID=2664684 RepID=A0A7I8VXP0_9ANNE|nr:DgyrCDS9678 [Dimorphilus gyrociliatus]